MSVTVKCPHCGKVLVTMKKPGDVKGNVTCVSCAWTMDLDLASRGIYFSGPPEERVNLGWQARSSRKGFLSRLLGRRSDLQVKKIQVIKIGNASPEEAEAHKVIKACVASPGGDEILKAAKRLVEVEGRIPLLSLTWGEIAEGQDAKSLDYVIEKRSPHASKIGNHTVTMDGGATYRVCICMYEAWVEADD